MLPNCPNCGAFARDLAKFCAECGYVISTGTTPLHRISQQDYQEPLNLSPGLILKDRYRIVKPVGIGGSGVVYRAWDLVLQIPCAIRVEMGDFDESAQQHFMRKISHLARLSHPGLSHVWDQFSIPDQGFFMVMTFIHGRSLETIVELADIPLSEKQILAWIEQICDALEYLHAQTPPLIHRNIKPRHIYITKKPLNSQAMLGGFGIACLQGKPIPKCARAVTPGFSPPEQYGLEEDIRVDVYGLGATLYYLLTNQTPPDSLKRKLEGAALIAPRSINPSISHQVEKSIITALQLDPEKRFVSVGAFKNSLLSHSPELPTTPLDDILPSDVQKHDPEKMVRKNDEEVASLFRQLSQHKRSMIILEERQASFIDPRSIPIDLEENIRLVREDIARKKNRLQLLGAAME